jgi:hypothetical protein
VPLAQAKHKRTDLGAEDVGLRMLKATLNNSANLSLSNPVEEICEVSNAGGTSGGVGSLRVTSSVFAPVLLVLKVIFAEGLQNPNKIGLLYFITYTARARKCILFFYTSGFMRQDKSVNQVIATLSTNGAQFSTGEGFSPCHHVETGSDAHPAT